MQRFREAVVTLMMGCLAAQATTYFIDFEGGNDEGDGLTAATAWKHAPGDANAAGEAAAVKLQPGDRVLFKGGVIYRGALQLTASGTAEAPIVYDGNTAGEYGEGKAIIDGSEPVSGWRRCESSADAHGAPEWEKVYRVTVAQDLVKAPLSLNIFEGETKAMPARSPNIDDPLSMHDMGYNYENEMGVSDVKPTSADLKPLYGAVPDDFAECAWISVWVLSNRLNWKKITAVEDSVVTFGEVKPHQHRGSYALWNHPTLLDRSGEFVLLEEKGQAVLFYRPHDVAGLSEVSISARTRGIDFNRKSHIVIQGFKVRRFAGSAYNDGAGIISFTSNKTHNLAILDCEITQNQSSEKAAGITIRNASGLRIAGNIIAENVGCAGIGTYSCEDLVVEHNLVRRNGGTALRHFTVDRARISDNSVFEHTGVHANGITVYIGSKNVVIERNNVRDGLFACTIQASENITIRQNLFDGTLKGSPALSLYSSPRNQPPPSNITVENNTLIGPGRNALRVDLPIPGLKVRKNVMDGGPDPKRNTIEVLEGNIYTRSADLHRNSGEAGAHYPDTHEGIFVDAAAGDYRLLPDSVAAQEKAGCSIETVLTQVKPGLLPRVADTEEKP